MEYLQNAHSNAHKQSKLQKKEYQSIVIQVADASYKTKMPLGDSERSRTLGSPLGQPCPIHQDPSIPKSRKHIRCTCHEIAPMIKKKQKPRDLGLMFQQSIFKMDIQPKLQDVLPELIQQSMEPVQKRSISNLVTSPKPREMLWRQPQLTRRTQEKLPAALDTDRLLTERSDREVAPTSTSVKLKKPLESARVKYHNPKYTVDRLKSLNWQNQKNMVFEQPCDAIQVRSELLMQSKKKREIFDKYSQLCRQQPQKQLTYSLLKGNNSALVRRVLEARQDQWEPLPQSSLLFNFKWCPRSQQVNFAQLALGGHRSVVNHFENHECLTEKAALFQNVKAAVGPEECLKFMPITFVIDFTNRYRSEIQLDRFTTLFGLLEKGKSLGQVNEAISKMKRKKRPILEVSDSLYAQKNLWLLKPSDCNRGTGVKLISKLDQLKPFIKDEFWVDKDQKKRPQQQDLTVNSDSWVVQKYIERPLLIDGRKFDIRLWVLITHELDCHLFKEGYVRTSSYAFSLDNHEQQIHLTNNAIQMLDGQYGQKEEGNQLSIADSSARIGVDLRQIIETDILEIITSTMRAVQGKLVYRKHCFEVFGYDFMIDESLKPWLIEVNTNPCLEESSQLLKELLPRMLDDCFKLTIDQIFNSSSQTSFPVKGFADDVNMWGDKFYKLKQQ